jgi:pyruvate dehydrogenase E1 component
VTIAVMGAVVPEALAAAERLAEIGTPADVVCVTSPGLLFRALRARQGLGPGEPWILEQAFPAARATPLVTVLDGHPHTLSFLATVNQVPHTALGVAQFGQSGSIDDLYRYNGIDADSIIRAALDLAPLRTLGARIRAALDLAPLGPWAPVSAPPWTWPL